SCGVGYPDSPTSSLGSRRTNLWVIERFTGRLRMLIPEAAARLPFRVKGLVYLSAFLLPTGQTPIQVMQFDAESILRSSLVIDTEKGVSTVSRELARSVFYADCDEADAQWAISQLQPEPLIPRVPAA